MTKATRDNAGKPPLSYLFDFPNSVEQFARVCEFGAKKYDRDNWRKGREFRDTIDSALRHIKDFQNGKNLDDETGLANLGHAMWNIMALIEWNSDLNLSFKFDDRYAPPIVLEEEDCPTTGSLEARFSEEEPDKSLEKYGLSPVLPPKDGIVNPPLIQGSPVIVEEGDGVVSVGAPFSKPRFNPGDEVVVLGDHPEGAPFAEGDYAVVHSVDFLPDTAEIEFVKIYRCDGAILIWAVLPNQIEPVSKVFSK